MMEKENAGTFPPEYPSIASLREIVARIQKGRPLPRPAAGRPVHGGYPDAGRDPFAHKDGSRECRPATAIGVMGPPSSGRMESARNYPEFDKHPLEREALRPSAFGGGGDCTNVRPAGSMPAVLEVACVGKRDGEGWKVCLLPGGAMLDPDAARALAGELIQMAEICEGKRW